MRFTIIIFLLIGCFAVRGQLMDSLPFLLRGNKSIDARLESRNSFVNHKLISVTGVRLGVIFNRKVRAGGGLSWINTGISDKFYNGKGSDSAATFLKFGYLCYYVDFVFYKTKHWQLSVPLQFGTGLAWFNNHSGYGARHKGPRYFLALYEPGITVQYKVVKWAGLGADVAYRFAVGKKTSDKLNSPTYSFKLLFWFDQLYYDLFPRSWITEEYGPGYW